MSTDQESASSSESPQQSSLPKKPAKKPRESPAYFPPIWCWIVVGLLLGVAVWLQYQATNFDFAMANVGTLICAFFAGLILLLWFTLFSAYQPVIRWTPAVSLTIGIVLIAALFEIHDPTGNMMPTLRFRWSLKPDQTLEKPTAAGAVEVDMATTTPNDFPQYLGPNRTGALAGVELSRDWKQNPPKQIWKQKIGAGWSGFAAVNGFAVTLEQRGAEELITCYDIATGKLLWWNSNAVRHETVLGGVGPRSTPTIFGGKVLTLGATGILQCLEGSSGKVVWKHDLAEEQGGNEEDEAKNIAWGRSGSPLIHEGKVIVPLGGPSSGKKASLGAYDLETGELLWTGGDRQVGYSSPLAAEIEGVVQILSENENNVSSHDPATGKVLWETDWPGHSNGDANTSQPIPLPENRVLLSKGYGVGAKLIEVSRQQDAWKVREVWQDSKLLKTKFTSCVVKGDYAYALSDGILECVKFDSGKRMWKKGRYGHGQILLVDDLLLVLSEDGELALVQAAPEAYKELGSFPALTGKTWNTLCLYGNKLLVRNGIQAACYELP